jgi:hypothetical protein
VLPAPNFYLVPVALLILAADAFSRSKRKE